jgi:hypothetical protein
LEELALRQSATHLRQRIIPLTLDRYSLSLGVVFLLMAAFYLWTAGSTSPLALHGQASDPYNQLANAFLHLRLSVGPAPAGFAHLSEPYNPTQNQYLQDSNGIHDFALYHGRLFLTWGPAPVVVLLIPMHLLGLEPSASFTAAFFAVIGLGFALGTLRAILRKIGKTPLWTCVLAGFTVALASGVPFILRRPEIYEEAVAGGFCFATIGVWFAISALTDGRASLWRLSLMSLCFGLAAGARPTLGVAALLLVPVYMALRSVRPRRGLLIALTAPVGGCFLLLLAYNQARFGRPLEFGTKYQLAGFDSYTAPFGRFDNILPGAWLYLLSPPRPTILFPFFQLPPPPISYPPGLPANYLTPEATAGLLPMAPIVLFLAALPWIWRRRPALLGSLAFPLLVMAAGGLACLLFLSYEFFSTTERYEVDFTTLLLLGAIAAWLALSVDPRVRRLRRHRLVRVGGGLLAAWSCLTGLAISLIGYENLLASSHPGLWSTLGDIGSPLSIAMASVAGHPVLAEVATSQSVQDADVSYTTLGVGSPSFCLSAGEHATATIVSPGARTATLSMGLAPGAQLGTGASLTALVHGPGHTSEKLLLSSGGGVAQIPLRLSRGLNRLVLSPLATATNRINIWIPYSKCLLFVSGMSLAEQS